MRRSLSSFLQAVGVGLMFFGAFHYAPVGLGIHRERDRLDGPPPGHPERLVPQVALSPVEKELWRQMRSIG
ncbi:DUF6059 family protein [Streptomyces morookaense]|uniref:DUF6059 family protein n=1 Tax=Streptomyces morookaense TaxID=1970 RepID=UPI0033F6DDE1